jgi:PKD repeat protein
MSALNTRAAVLVLAAALTGAACGVAGVSAPTPTGPSELGLSLEISATPDVISQDGVSTSRLSILARGPNGLPMSGVALRVDVLVPTDNGLVVADYGKLSDRWPTTGTDGRALVVYQAPPQPAPTVTTDTTVTLRVTPIGSNFANTVPRVVDVKLLRPGTIRPPTRMEPKFTFSPSSPKEHDSIFFDASSSLDPDGQIVSYTWNWGDGSTGSGRQTTHSYELAATYAVVLTVTDAYGTSVSTPATAIAIGTSANPVARFTFSPTNVNIDTNVTFNAGASTASAGRKIVGYNWDLGDGVFKEGVVVTHRYTAPGTYTVTLIVTDDGGRKGVVSQTLTVSDANNPTASFTFSPSSPNPGTTVFFDAAASSAPFGRTIVSYDWNFGDGSTGSGVTPNHAFATTGTFTVTLTVTDSSGRKGVKSSTVSVTSFLSEAPTLLDLPWESNR